MSSVILATVTEMDKPLGHPEVFTVIKGMGKPQSTHFAIQRLVLQLKEWIMSCKVDPVSSSLMRTLVQASHKGTFLPSKPL